MAELDDLHLNEQTPFGARLSGPPSRPSLLIPGLAVVAIFAIAAAVYFGPRLLHHEVSVQTTTQPAAAVATPRPAAEPGANIALPPLDETDALVRQLVSQVSSHPRVMAWLATDGLLRNFATVIANIADGETPIRQLSKQRPAAPFSARETGTNAVIDAQSFHRYDAYADAVAGLDARATARLYETLKPRISDAYRELGYPDGDIDGAMERAIIVLLRTPPASDAIAVKHTSVNWQFADPELESLPRAQRQLLRMGPRNEDLIKKKLRELAPYLGIDATHLPQ